MQGASGNRTAPRPDIEAEGSIEELLASCEEMQRIWWSELTAEAPPDGASPTSAEVTAAAITAIEVKAAV